VSFLGDIRTALAAEKAQIYLPPFKKPKYAEIGGLVRDTVRKG
jgi:hypothetical protein